MSTEEKEPTQEVTPVQEEESSKRTGNQQKMPTWEEKKVKLEEMRVVALEQAEEEAKKYESPLGPKDSNPLLE